MGYKPKFRVKDKVVCIDDVVDSYDPEVDLTCGKTYVVWSDSIMDKNQGVDVAFVKDDADCLYDYRASRFVSVIEYRDMVINEVLS